MKSAHLTYPRIAISCALSALLGDSIALSVLPMTLLLIPAICATGLSLYQTFLVRPATKKQSTRLLLVSTTLLTALALFIYHRANLVCGCGSSPGDLPVGTVVLVRGVVHSMQEQAKTNNDENDRQRILNVEQTEAADHPSAANQPGIAKQPTAVQAAATNQPDQAFLDLSVTDVLFPAFHKASGTIKVGCDHCLVPRKVGGSREQPNLSSLNPGSIICCQLKLRKQLALGNGCFKFGSRDFFYCRKLWVDESSTSRPELLYAKLGTLVENRAAIVRQRMVQTHQQNLGENTGSLLASMVLGDKAVQIDSNTLDQFRTVGLSHVLAASGFNLTVVIAMTYFLARIVLRCESFVHIVCFVTMVGYVCLSGASASVMRASIMCAIILTIKSTRRKPHYLAILAFALLLTILLDPASILDVGLQLSYGATAGIMLLARPITNMLCKARSGPVKWFVETIAVVLASQSAVLPIQLVFFWQIGLMFVPANLIVAPILAPITVLGFASSVLATIPMVASWTEPVVFICCRALDYVAALPLIGMLISVQYLAKFDSAVVHIGEPAVWATAAYVVSWILFVSSLNFSRYRVIALTVYCAALTILLWQSPLEKTAIACLPHEILVVNQHKRAVLISRSDRGAVPKGSDSGLVQNQSDGKPVQNYTAGWSERYAKKFAARHGWSLASRSASIAAASAIQTDDALFVGTLMITEESELEFAETCLRTNPDRIVILICRAQSTNPKRSKIAWAKMIDVARSGVRAPRFVLFVGNEEAVMKSANALCDYAETLAPQNCARRTPPNITVLTEGCEAVLVPL